MVKINIIGTVKFVTSTSLIQLVWNIGHLILARYYYVNGDISKKAITEFSDISIYDSQLPWVIFNGILLPMVISLVIGRIVLIYLHDEGDRYHGTSKLSIWERLKYLISSWYFIANITISGVFLFDAVNNISYFDEKLSNGMKEIREKWIAYESELLNTVPKDIPPHLMKGCQIIRPSLLYFPNREHVYVGETGYYSRYLLSNVGEEQSALNESEFIVDENGNLKFVGMADDLELRNVNNKISSTIELVVDTLRYNIDVRYGEDEVYRGYYDDTLNQIGREFESPDYRTCISNLKKLLLYTLFPKCDAITCSPIKSCVNTCEEVKVACGEMIEWLYYDDKIKGSDINVDSLGIHNFFTDMKLRGANDEQISSIQNIITDIVWLDCGSNLFDNHCTDHDAGDGIHRSVAKPCSDAGILAYKLEIQAREKEIAEHREKLAAVESNIMQDQKTFQNQVASELVEWLDLYLIVRAIVAQLLVMIYILFQVHRARICGRSRDAKGSIKPINNPTLIEADPCATKAMPPSDSNSHSTIHPEGETVVRAVSIVSLEHTNGGEFEKSLAVISNTTTRTGAREDPPTVLLSEERNIIETSGTDSTKDSGEKLKLFLKGNLPDTFRLLGRSGWVVFSLETGIVCVSVIFVSYVTLKGGVQFNSLVMVFSILTSLISQMLLATVNIRDEGLSYTDSLAMEGILEQSNSEAPTHDPIGDVEEKEEKSDELVISDARDAIHKDAALTSDDVIGVEDDAGSAADGNNPQSGHNRMQNLKKKLESIFEAYKTLFSVDRQGKYAPLFLLLQELVEVYIQVSEP